MFYQTLQNATGGDNNSGGINASQVGYGAQLGGIDIDMGRSALQSTGRPMDVAITGEGFFQVMDPDGNIFYTRAGNLALDSASGNLVDANGYTVLGVSGDPLGKEPSSDKIHLNIPSQSNSPASKTQTINGIQYTVTSENATGCLLYTSFWRCSSGAERKSTRSRMKRCSEASRKKKLRKRTALLHEQRRTRSGQQ